MIADTTWLRHGFTGLDKGSSSHVDKSRWARIEPGSKNFLNHVRYDHFNFCAVVYSI